MPTIELQDMSFRKISEGALDSKKRLALTKVLVALRGLFGDVEAERLCFTIHCNSTGEILLVPEITIPLREAWLHRNPAALKSVLTGIEQAGKGELIDRGSFAEYANEDIE